MAKTAYILTFGCQMNEYDSEVLESILAAEGYLLVDSAHDADVVIVNTCSVRKKAETRAVTRISGLAAAKKANPSQVIVIAGCMAKRAGEKLIENIPGVDYVVGPDFIPDIPEIIRNNGRQRVYLADRVEFPGLSFKSTPGGVCAYVAISRGCENFCSYCIVPYVRGPLRSRPVASIIAEMQMLVERGVKDITLLGQNVNSYCDKGIDFPQLLRSIAPFSPPRLRFLTSHPKDLSDNLIRCFAEIPEICHWLHLPLQSGSDKILAAMNRGYGTSHYLELVDKLRAAVPEITLTTDLIVGFPGETEADFERTLHVVKQIGFDSAFMFRYSVRPGTSAAQLCDDVSEDIKIRRLDALITLQQEISQCRNARWQGRTVEILIEGTSRRRPPLPKGRLRGGQSVLIRGNPALKPGDVVAGKIESTQAKTLFARVGRLA